MSDSTGGTAAAPSGENDQGPAGGGGQGPRSAGDTLGGERTPTGNDGTMGADAPTGDASLADAAQASGVLPDGADTPSEVYGDDA